MRRSSPAPPRTEVWRLFYILTPLLNFSVYLSKAKYALGVKSVAMVTTARHWVNATFWSRGDVNSAEVCKAFNPQCCYDLIQGYLHYESSEYAQEPKSLSISSQLWNTGRLWTVNDDDKELETPKFEGCLLIHFDYSGRSRGEIMLYYWPGGCPWTASSVHWYPSLQTNQRSFCDTSQIMIETSFWRTRVLLYSIISTALIVIMTSWDFGGTH